MIIVCCFQIENDKTMFMEKGSSISWWKLKYYLRPKNKANEKWVTYKKENFR